MAASLDWLQQIFCHLYIFVKTRSQTKSFLSPFSFLSCPVQSTAVIRAWFIDFWNSQLHSFLRQVGEDGEGDWEDPVMFVLRTWPWPGEGEEELQQVRTDRQQPGGNSDSDPLVS